MDGTCMAPHRSLAPSSADGASERAAAGGESCRRQAEGITAGLSCTAGLAARYVRRGVLYNHITITLRPDLRPHPARPPLCRRPRSLTTHARARECDAEDLRTKWVTLDSDAETQVYLSRCLNRPRFQRHLMGVRRTPCPSFAHVVPLASRLWGLCTVCVVAALRLSKQANTEAWTSAHRGPPVAARCPLCPQLAKESIPPRRLLSRSQSVELALATGTCSSPSPRTIHTA